MGMPGPKASSCDISWGSEACRKWLFSNKRSLLVVHASSDLHIASWDCQSQEKSRLLALLCKHAATSALAESDDILQGLSVAISDHVFVAC